MVEAKVELTFEKLVGFMELGRKLNDLDHVTNWLRELLVTHPEEVFGILVEARDRLVAEPTPDKEQAE